MSRGDTIKLPLLSIYLLQFPANMRPSVPANVTFYVDDLEDDWDYEEPFDFIYGRMLSGALMNYPAFIKQAFE